MTDGFMAAVEVDEAIATNGEREWPEPGPHSLPLHWLVEDLRLWPRDSLDGSNIRDMVNTLKMGEELPPLVVERGSGRLTDGFHRRSAYIRVYGVDHEVPVIIKEYASEAEAYSDAVRLNRSHGRKLNSSDLIKAARRLGELGIDVEAVAVIVKMPPAEVKKITARIAVNEAQEPVPLKAGDKHLQGQTLNDEQIEALTHRLGVPYGRLARQIIDGARNNMLPSDESFWEVLREMHEAVGEALARHDAQ